MSGERGALRRCVAVAPARRWLAFAWRWITISTLAAGVVCVASGCASLPAAVERPASSTLVASADAPLARIAAEAGASGELSAFRPLSQANHALDARLELIRRARVSLDLQTYLLADDSTGRLVLRELRAAARRGVRVRLLVDDLYADGIDELLLGFAAQPNVEVRLFNPFAYGRDGSITRFWHLLTDFRRLNHRMHNKLFVADGVVAIAGGRNIADEYFLRSTQANFIDFEMVVAGSLVPRLSAFFDSYWNSDQVWPVQAVARSTFTSAELGAAFDRMVFDVPEPAPLTQPDELGRLPLGIELDTHRPRMVVAMGYAAADRPDKRNADLTGAADTVADRYDALVREARHEVITVSPYFVPGQRGLRLVRELRERGVAFRVVTNATSTTDEPLVSFRSARYRRALLEEGVQLYELESVHLAREPAYHDLFGRSRGRLHAKLAVLDREWVLLGSMNLDPRSASINTEIGIAVRSPELARESIPTFDLERIPGLLQVRLKDDGRIEWVAHDGAQIEHLDAAPGVTWAQSLRLFLLSLFVAEDQL